jgi:hypothetical protein
MAGEVPNDRFNLKWIPYKGIKGINGEAQIGA